MERRKLKTLELKNTNIKNFQSSQKERQIPISPPMRNFTQFFLKTHKMNNKKN